MLASLLPMLAAAAVPCSLQPSGCGVLGGPEQRAMLGVDSMEKLAASNVEIIRIFTEDGFGGRNGAVSYVRRPGHEPAIEIVTGGDERAVLSMPIPLSDWDQVQLEVANFDAPAPPPNPQDGPLICLHPSTQRLEVIDRPHANMPMRIRQRTQSGCEQGSTFAAAVLLLREAARIIPACALLNRDQWPDPAALLAFCASMEGDRAAVAEARNVYGSPWLDHPRTAAFHDVIQYQFYDFAEMTWPGDPSVKGEREVAIDWADKFSRYRLFPRFWRGLDGSHVEVSGAIVSPDENAPGKQRLRFSMIMTKENGFPFRIRRMDVSIDDRRR